VEEDTVKLPTRLVALSAVVAIVAACSGSGASGEPTQGGASASVTQAAPTAEATLVTIAPPTDLITEGTLTDCVDIEYPPMEFFPTDVTDPNLAIGFDVDAARAVADRFGLAIEIRNTAFDALIADLQAGRCDIVWSALYISETRLEVADAVPYMATGQVVMVPVGNPLGIGQESDLCGKTISIQGGGLVQERAEAASAACEAAGSEPIEIRAFRQVAEQFAQIVNGQVDAVWETDTAVLNFGFDHPGEYEVAYELPREDNYGVYYGKGKTDVGEALTAAIAALKDDGTLAALATRYNMDPAILDIVE
jgi:polar amino acid transport system substrate-binding protein